MYISVQTKYILRYSSSKTKKGMMGFQQVSHVSISVILTKKKSIQTKIELNKN